MADDGSPLAMSSALGPQSANVVPGSGFGGAPQQPQQQQPQTPTQQLGNPDAQASALLAKAQADKEAHDKYQAETDKLIGGLREKLSMGAPAYPDQQKLPKPPDPQDFRKNSMEFASAFAVLGALAGKFTRTGGTGALNAFAGAMKGWQEGNMTAYKQASEEWAQKTEQTLQNNKMVLDKYKAIISNRQMSIENQVLALKMVASQYQDKIAYDALENQNYGMFASLYDKQVAAHDNAVESFMKLNGPRLSQDAEARGKAKFLESPEGQARLAQASPDEQFKARGFIATWGSGAPQTSSGGALPKSAPAMYARSVVDEYRRTHDGQDPPSEYIAEKMANYNTSQSAGRTLGTRFANTGFAAEEARGTFDQALQASEAMPRGQYVPLNRWKQAGQAAMSDPNFRRFKDANEAAVTAYGATMSRSGANTVAAQTRAHEVLDTADSPEAYKAGIEQLQREVKIVEEAPEHARTEIMNRIFGHNQGGGSAGGEQTTSTGVKWSVQP